MNKTKALLERQSKVMLPVINKMLLHGDNPIAFSHGKNQWLYDIEGKKYLDFFGGILTVSVGHANEDITNATIEQLKTLQTGASSGAEKLQCFLQPCTDSSGYT